MHRIRRRTNLPAIGVTAVLAVAAAVHGAERVRYDGYRLARVTASSPADVRAIEAAGGTILDCIHGPGPLEVVLPAEAVARLEAAGMQPVVLHEDVQALIDAERARTEAGNAAEAGAGGGLCDTAWFADYKPLDAIIARIDDIVAAYPAIAERIDLGNTLEGRPIVALRLTSPDGPAQKPVVLFNGCQHAREWVAPMTVSYIATMLACGEDVDPAVTDLLDRVEFWIVPVVNADGYVWSWDVDRFWRKNRRDNLQGDFGVDLNRNWDIDWNGGNSTSTDPGEDTYVGTAPFSEPETQVLRDFLLARTYVAAHIDFHSYSQLVLQPWGFTNSPPPDDATIEPLAEDMVDAIFSVHGEDYVNGQPGEVLYLASGVFPDWLYDTLGSFAYTIELRPTDGFFGGGFELPEEEILPTGEEAFAAALVLADFAADGIRIEFPQGTPDDLEPDAPASVRADLYPTHETLQPGSPMLYWRLEGEPAFSTIPMTNLFGAVFFGTLPGASCGDVVEYFVEALSTDGAGYRAPAGAPANLFTAQVICDGTPGDVTGDGVVDVADLVEVIVNWGPCAAPCPADLDGSGAVDVADLVEVIVNWSA